MPAAQKIQWTDSDGLSALKNSSHFVGRNPVLDDRYMPSKCESCLLFANEIEGTLRRVPLSMSASEQEATLIGELESICDKMLEYRLHKDKEGLARFSKEFSPTSKLIKGLKAKGVEVKLDVPAELLDQPSLESGQLKMVCEWLVEEYEEEVNPTSALRIAIKITKFPIHRWFFKRRQDSTLRHYLCESRHNIGCSSFASGSKEL